MVDKTPAQLKDEAEKAALIKKQEEEQKRREEASKAAASNKPEQKPAESKPAPAASTSTQQKSAGGGTVGGAMSTYGSSKQAIEFDLPEISMTRDEVKALAGDIQRGELARVELDENGTPTGPAFREVPTADQVVAPVYGTPTVVQDELVTPSGAPITKQMNPEPVLWDAGMLARNPPPPHDERRERYRQQGGGVINQPVLV